MATIIAFGYSQYSVDIWYQDSGCQTVDNGKIGAWQGGSASFAAFQTTLVGLAPASSSPGSG